MKNEMKYKLLILFVIFIVIKKTVSIAVELKYPTYDNLNNASEFWKTLVKVRDIFAILTVLFGCYFLYNFHLNIALFLVILLGVIHQFLYFLIDKRYVYIFIPKNEANLKIVTFADTYGDSIENTIIFLVGLYALKQIFN